MFRKGEGRRGEDTDIRCPIQDEETEKGADAGAQRSNSEELEEQCNEDGASSSAEGLEDRHVPFCLPQDIEKDEKHGEKREGHHQQGYQPSSGRTYKDRNNRRVDGHGDDDCGH